jgi:hypothetical protein
LLRFLFSVLIAGTFFTHGLIDMAKPPKTPRPNKGPILPPQENERVELSIGRAHEKLIGRIVVGWSRVDGILEDCIWELLNVKIEVGRVITARLDASSKIKMIRALSPVILTEAQLHKIVPIIDRVDILREVRNQIIHGLWGRNEWGIPFAISLRTKPLERDQVVSEPFPDTRLQEILAEIQNSILALTSLMRELRSSRDRLPRQHPEG